MVVILLQFIDGHNTIVLKLASKGVLGATAILFRVTTDVKRLLLTAWLHESLLLLSRAKLLLVVLIHLYVLHFLPHLHHQLVFAGEVI